MKSSLGAAGTDNPPNVVPHRKLVFAVARPSILRLFQRLRYTLFCGSQVHIAGALNARFEDLGDVVRGSLERTTYEMNDPN
jgi:hypothetical protein